MKTENIIIIIVMFIMCIICAGTVVTHDTNFSKTDDVHYNLIAHDVILSEIRDTSDNQVNGFNSLLSSFGSIDCNAYGPLLINPNGELTDGKSLSDMQLTKENNTVNNSTDVNSTNSAVSIDDILDAAAQTKSYIENNNQVPNTITIGDKEYSSAEALYLFDKAIVNIENGDFSDIEPVQLVNQMIHMVLFLNQNYMNINMLMFVIGLLIIYKIMDMHLIMQVVIMVLLVILN